MKKILIALSLVFVTSCTSSTTTEKVSNCDTLVENIDTTLVVVDSLSTDSLK